MTITWGTRKWEVTSAICIILIFGYGTYVVLIDILAGHQIWWYNLSLPIFALTILGLLLLVRIGKKTLSNIFSYGLNPSSKESPIEDDVQPIQDYIDNIDPDDRDYEEERE